LLDNGSEVHNINIAIAAAITAIARIHKSQFKNNKDYNLYYSDTDSIYIDKPLNNKGKELGLMKLEYICDDAIFLAPKVYSLITDSGVIKKIKGITSKVRSKITIDELKELLNKDSKLESPLLRKKN